ncbi:LytR/AlgR family response regulator transcription factor [Aequorivita antarctica]|uniref:Response regulator transcription factor n=1 Tax=Aequorivita antarctica TaxID=153266 RepID=A0A5C6YYC4_9FLAO|nr:LytTR family DNA-binding domain-containing protein [Aequorivita antarctica]TXD72734.1 response regulator transcription factor [Aequorivita antarctica]SRX74741.1 Sensory transduction protein LytR [Aequorivita antarctica]
MIGYIIIEKESETLERIQDLLEGFDQFHFLGNYQEYDRALNAILKESPQLVFLNIDYMFDDIFTFVAEIYKYCEIPPALIGLSYTKERAYDLIKNNFFDLLLKPIAELDLRKCVLSYNKRYSQQHLEKLCLKSYGDFQYLDIKNILYLKADNNTTDFHMVDGSIVGAFKTLKNYEDVLPKNFIRIHRSYIVNSKYVSRIHYGKCICSISRKDVKLPFTKAFLKNIDLINDRLSMTSYSLLDEASLS